MSITVVDSIMGSGKSTWVRNYMNSHPEKRWWYIAVYLNEASVPKEGCPGLNFVEPSDENTTKGKNLISLINKGENIASTHQLFLRINQTPELLEQIREQGYTLVIDEVLNVVTDFGKKNDDIQPQIQAHTFSVDDENHKLTWLNEEYKGKEFLEVKKKARTEDIYYNGEGLISLFKSDIFNAFQDVYVLTYLFAGSDMRMYFDFNKLNYTTRHIVNGELSQTKPDNLTEKNRIKTLINLYDGPRYQIGSNRYNTYHLSKSWYFQQKHFAAQETLFRNTYNYLYNDLHAKSNETMYTVFKQIYDKNPNMIPSYKKSFVECNAIATNMYRDRLHLAYLVNMFKSPETDKFFSQHGVTCNEDEYARSSMLQWIWRSAIRDNRPITLFIPSQRMRNIFISWLNKSD